MNLIITEPQFSRLTLVKIIDDIYYIVAINNVLKRDDGRKKNFRKVKRKFGKVKTSNNLLKESWRILI